MPQGQGLGVGDEGGGGGSYVGGSRPAVVARSDNWRGILDQDSWSRELEGVLGGGLYRVFHDTGHLKIWLSPRPIINMNWTPEYFLSA